MSQQQNNTISLEALAIQKAINAGHKDPRSCPKHQACLNVNGLNRGILDYKVVSIKKIITNNVRVQDIDVKYCEDEIGPLIQRKMMQVPTTMGLNYPLLVTQKGNYYHLISGHNRKWSVSNILGKDKIPVFIVDNKGTPIEKLIGRIVANSKTENDNRRYKMIDAILHLQEFELNNGFSDTNDIEQTRKEFENFMDKIHPFQFTSPTARGKIFKGWQKTSKKATSIHITWDENYEDSILSRNMYPTRYYLTESNKKKKHSWLSNVCEKQKCFVDIAIREDMTPRMCFSLMRKWLDPDFREKFDGYSMHLIIKINSVPSNEIDLKQTQKRYLEEVITINNVLKNCKNNLPLIEKIIFPIRLKEQKKDHIYVYDKKSDKFK